MTVSENFLVLLSNWKVVSLKMNLLKLKQSFFNQLIAVVNKLKICNKENKKARRIDSSFNDLKALKTNILLDDHKLNF